MALLAILLGPLVLYLILRPFESERMYWYRYLKNKYGSWGH